MERVGQFSFSVLILVIIILVAIFWMSIPKNWEEVTRKKNNGGYELSEVQEKAIEDKIEKIENQELYALVAAKNGMYLCKHCPGKKFFLFVNEVYRYGTTGNGQSGRGYTESWQLKNNLKFVHLMYGDEVTVKVEQTKLIGSYPIHSDNMSRPLKNDVNAKSYWYRLVLPPGNTKLD